MEKIIIMLMFNFYFFDELALITIFATIVQILAKGFITSIQIIIFFPFLVNIIDTVIAINYLYLKVGYHFLYLFNAIIFAVIAISIIIKSTIIIIQETNTFIIDFELTDIIGTA